MSYDPEVQKEVEATKALLEELTKRVEELEAVQAKLRAALGSA